MALYILLGLFIGILINIGRIIARSISVPYSRAHSIFFSLIFISLILVRFRARSLDDINIFLKFYTKYLFLLLVFCFFVLITIIYIRKFPNNKPRVLHGALLLFSLSLCLALFILFVPFLNDLYVNHIFKEKPQETKQPNIIFLVLDTLRADYVSCINNKFSLTPNIDNIAKEGIIFARAISPAPWTLPSMASIFTGLYPCQHHATWEYRHLDDELFTLTEYLSSLKYKTVGFVENPFLSKLMGMAQGFDEYFEMYSYSRKSTEASLIDRLRIKFFGYKPTLEYSNETIGQFKRWVLNNNGKIKRRPFFAFINLMAAHLPNYPRPKFMDQNIPKKDLDKIEPINLVPERYYLPQYKLDSSDLENMRTLYKGEIAFLDDQLGSLFKFLSKSNILDNTVLIITADHGENFGDHGLIEHQFCLYNSVLHVPLIIRYPRKINAGTNNNNNIVSTIFLFQSLIDLIGGRENSYTKQIENRSLFKEEKDPSIYAEDENCIKMIRRVLEDEAPPNFNFNQFNKSIECIYTQDYKFILLSNGQKEMFDLRTDWNEENVLDLQHDPKSISMLIKLNNWRDSISKTTISPQIKVMDKATNEALRSLGYIK